MKILNILMILGVIAVVTAGGVALSKGGILTGFSIFGGEEQDSNSDFSKEQLDGSNETGSGDANPVLNDTASINDTNDTVVEESTSSGGGGGGGSSSPDPVIPKETCNGEDDDGNGLVDDGNLCDDGNSLTIDSCKLSIVDFNNETNESVYGKECVNILPNLYGKVYDTDLDDIGVPGIEVSFYNSSQYNPYNMTGDYESLLAKDTPELVTDADGEYATFVDPDKEYHLVFNGSDEKSFNVAGDNLNNTIITETKGYIKVYFEKASAALKSDLYIKEPVEELLVEKSGVGEIVHVNNETIYDAGTELEFFIRVHGTSWGIGEYNHKSNSKYCQVERLDKDTWRLHFEDLPASWPPDWDFNDAVVLVDIINASTGEDTNDSTDTINNDCDGDGIINWLDYNDSECDFGQEDTEIEENDTHGNFNAEGHIIYSGEYGPDNKYVCGDKLKFTMFGINHRDPDETITFMVEDHSVKKGTNGDEFYRGNISNPGESLFVPNDGTKYTAEFDYEIPCDLPEGKHDIHIMWNNEKFHKIGNFFVIKDTTNPTIIAEGGSALPNEPIEVGISAEDPPQPDSMRSKNSILTIQILLPDDSITVNIDKDILTDGEDGDGITDNDIDYNTTGGDVFQNVTYNASGEYTARLTVIDPSNKTNSTDINNTVFISEEKANTFALEIYSLFGVAISEDINVTIQASAPDVFMNIDRYNPSLEVGDEYMTPSNNVSSEDSFAPEEDQINGLNAVMGPPCTGPEYVKPIPPSTEEDFKQILTGYLTHLRDSCHAI